MRQIFFTWSTNRSAVAFFISTVIMLVNNAIRNQSSHLSIKSIGNPFILPINESSIAWLIESLIDQVTKASL